MGFRLVFSKQALKDAKRLEQAGLARKAKELLKVVRENPLQNPPAYEKLVGDLAGKYSRRINIHHRMVYKVLEEDGIVVVFRMWTHYEYKRSEYCALVVGTMLFHYLNSTFFSSSFRSVVRFA